MRTQNRIMMRFVTALCFLIIICTTPTPSFAWSTSGGNNLDTNTHFWILNSAIDILKKNDGNRVTPQELKLLEEWKEFLGLGISFADYNACLNSAFSYGSHFYDPDTGKSFIPTKTARDMGAYYFYKAGNTYKEGHALRAFYYLGLSLHYLTDITQPMHAGNLTALSPKVPGYHNKFEDFAATRHKLSKVEDGDAYWDWQGRDPYQWLHNAAVGAKKQLKTIYNKKIIYWYWRSSYNYAYTRRWQDIATPVIQEQLTEAQRIAAGYIHMWFETYVS